MMEHGNSTAQHLTPEERSAAAMAIWNHEKGLAAAVIIVTWTFKVYDVHESVAERQFQQRSIHRFTLL